MSRVNNPVGLKQFIQQQANQTPDAQIRGRKHGFFNRSIGIYRKGDSKGLHVPFVTTSSTKINNAKKALKAGLGPQFEAAIDNVFSQHTRSRISGIRQTTQGPTFAQIWNAIKDVQVPGTNPPQIPVANAQQFAQNDQFNVTAQAKPDQIDLASDQVIHGDDELPDDLETPQGIHEKDQKVIGEGDQVFGEDDHEVIGEDDHEVIGDDEIEAAEGKHNTPQGFGEDEHEVIDDDIETPQVPPKQLVKNNVLKPVGYSLAKEMKFDDKLVGQLFYSRLSPEARIAFDELPSDSHKQFRIEQFGAELQLKQLKLKSGDEPDSDLTAYHYYSQLTGEERAEFDIAPQSSQNDQVEIHKTELFQQQQAQQLDLE